MRRRLAACCPRCVALNASSLLRGPSRATALSAQRVQGKRGHVIARSCRPHPRCLAGPHLMTLTLSCNLRTFAGAASHWTTRHARH